jgi:hypothetical protein
VPQQNSTCSFEFPPVSTPAQLAKTLQVSVDKARSIFEREPGVLVLQTPKRGVRRYRTLRIPADVAQRVVRRLSVPAA